MNKVFLMGRLTKSPEDKGNRTVYTLAVDSRSDHTDFIYCVAFKKQADFANKYLKKGMKIVVVGALNVYSGENGNTFTSVVVNEHYFCEPKKGE